MSIRRAIIATCCAPLLLAQAAPEATESEEVSAEEPQPITAEEAFEAAEEAYGPPEPEPEVSVDCEEASGNEIVVCAALEEQSQFRVTSNLDKGDDSHLSWDGAAPNLEPVYPGPVVARGCFIPPCPPPPVYYIDIEALPEAPPGSDADKIANGEIPER